MGSLMLEPAAYIRQETIVRAVNLRTLVESQSQVNSASRGIQ